MSEPGGRDPVTAISESAATGVAAEIFAEIRDVMQIPLITSIWRILAGIDGGLETVWNAAKPIYESGQPDEVLFELRSKIDIPVPESPPAGISDISASDLQAINAIVGVYNRSNTLNLIALNGVISTTAVDPVEHASDAAPAAWSALPSLLERDEIDQSTWSLLEKLKRFGASEPDPAIATLWRHFAHWPDLLEQLIEAYEPLQRDGVLFASNTEVTEFARANGARMAHYRGETGDIPDEALELVSGYVSNPSAVSRMVVLGHSVEAWLTADHR